MTIIEFLGTALGSGGVTVVGRAAVDVARGRSGAALSLNKLALGRVAALEARLDAERDESKRELAEEREACTKQLDELRARVDRLARQNVDQQIQINDLSHQLATADGS